MKTSKKLIMFLSVFLILLINIESVSFASIDDNITEAYKLWAELPEEQKIKTIEPLPYNVNINDSMKASNFSKYLGLGETLETKYDIRDYIKMNVKNQENTNWCWAFSTTSVLESNLAKTRNKYLTFSPKH